MAKTRNPEFVASLERGLKVLQTFSREHPQLTLSEVAALTTLTPATARRSLHTLEKLGYLGRSGRRFMLRPKVLSIGSGYLSAINAEVVLQPFLQEVANEVGGTVGDVPTAGHRIHAHASVTGPSAKAAWRAYRCTASMGRVLWPLTGCGSDASSAVDSGVTEHTKGQRALRRVFGAAKGMRESRTAGLRMCRGRAHLLTQRPAVAASMLGRTPTARSRPDDQGSACRAAQPLPIEGQLSQSRAHNREA